jgi:hypothetical protein
MASVYIVVENQLTNDSKKQANKRDKLEVPLENALGTRARASLA